MPIYNSNGNSNENSGKKSNENNSENNTFNEAKILTSKKKTRDEKIDDLIELGYSAIEIMRRATEAMEKSNANQEIIVKYIYDVMKRQEKEEEEKKKKQEELKKEEEQKKIIKLF